MIQRIKLSCQHNNGYDSAKSELKQKKENQTLCAVKSLYVSGEKSGFFPENLKKGDNGQPLPSKGVFWSISHKDEYAAGLVSKSPAGIDLEKLKNIALPLFKKIVSPHEKQCFNKERDNIIFFKCFTAKEAVLKAVGVGLTGLSDIVVTKADDSFNTWLSYKNIEYKVEHFFFDKYIASVVKNDLDYHYEIEWCID